MTEYLKGLQTAQEIKIRVKNKLNKLKSKPKLVSIMANDDGAILNFAESQKKLCDEIGIDFQMIKLLKNSSQKDILKAVKKLNKDPNVHGIMILMPVPQNVDADTIQESILHTKDVEGISPYNLGRLFYGDFRIAPCTAKAVWLLLKDEKIGRLSGKEVVIISQSKIVGSPLTIMLLQAHMASPTITCCHKGTRDLSYHTKKADIIIVAAGKPKLITGDMIKKGGNFNRCWNDSYRRRWCRNNGWRCRSRICMG